LWGKSLIVALYCNTTVYTILFDAAAKQLLLRNHCFRKNSVSFEMKSQENFQVVQYCSQAVPSAWASLLVTSSKLEPLLLGGLLLFRGIITFTRFHWEDKYSAALIFWSRVSVKRKQITKLCPTKSNQILKLQRAMTSN